MFAYTTSNSDGKTVKIYTQMLILAYVKMKRLRHCVSSIIIIIIIIKPRIQNHAHRKIWTSSFRMNDIKSDLICMRNLKIFGTHNFVIINFDQMSDVVHSSPASDWYIPWDFSKFFFLSLVFSVSYALLFHSRHRSKGLANWRSL